MSGPRPIDSGVPGGPTGGPDHDDRSWERGSKDLRLNNLTGHAGGIAIGAG